MERGYSQLQWAARVSLVLLAVFCIPTMGMAGQDVLDKTKDVIIDKPAERVKDVFDDDDNDSQYNSCGQKIETYSGCPSNEIQEKPKEAEVPGCPAACPTMEKPKEAEVPGCPAACPTMEKPKEAEVPACPAACPAGTAESPIPVTIDDLRHHGEDYYGKTVTVDGKIDDTFSDQAFTIKGHGHEVLVVSESGMCNAVVPLDQEVKEGRPVRVTAVVEPFDESKLCTYGVNLEGREKHLAKSPMLMVKKTEAAKLEEPQITIIQLPAPPPAPMPEAEAAPAPEPAPAPAPPEERAALPRTASEIPLLGLGGLFALGAGFAIRRFRTD